MEKEELIKKWLDGSLDEEERKLFESSEEFLSLQKMDRSVKSFKAPDYSVDEELLRLNKRKHGDGKSVTMTWLNPIIKIAAVLLVIISTYFFFYLNIDTTIQTASGEKSEFYLPDSSSVTLNANSNASFKERVWKYKRQVNLEGEAFFSVAKGSRFDVESSEGIVSVLGTKFNVKNRQDYFEVVCYEGLVQVESNGTTSKLSPGDGFRLINGNSEEYDHLTDKMPSWISGQSSFVSVPIAQVFDEFEQQYGVEIKTDNIDQTQLFSGTFLHDDMELALKAITNPLGIKYNITPDNKVLLSLESD